MNIASGTLLVVVILGYPAFQDLARRSPGAEETGTGSSEQEPGVIPGIVRNTTACLRHGILRDNTSAVPQPCGFEALLSPASTNQLQHSIE